MTILKLGRHVCFSQVNAHISFNAAIATSQSHSSYLMNLSSAFSICASVRLLTEKAQRTTFPSHLSYDLTPIFNTSTCIHQSKRQGNEHTQCEELYFYQPLNHLKYSIMLKGQNTLTRSSSLFILEFELKMLLKLLSIKTVYWIKQTDCLSVYCSSIVLSSIYHSMALSSIYHFISLSIILSIVSKQTVCNIHKCIQSK